MWPKIPPSTILLLWVPRPTAPKKGKRERKTERGKNRDKGKEGERREVREVK